MKIIIAPDKFKGSLDSFQVCEAIARGIGEVDKNGEVISFPMADGGDGFGPVMKYYLGTETIHCITKNPLGKEIKATYEWDSRNKTAIIEMAVASGLNLLRKEERDPLKTSTYGTGLLIGDAIEKGAKKIILGLGGSATNDGGTGILSAIGFEFRNARDERMEVSGENLIYIEKIICPSLLPEVEFEIACDVQNVLFGKQGAAYVYGGQKGADARAKKLLDEGLQQLAKIIYRQTGNDISNIPGTGAAGGVAAGLMAFFNVELKKGIHLVIEASGIEKVFHNVDILITGEGKIDSQSIEGKVVGELAVLAKKYNVPVAAFCGVWQANRVVADKLGLTYVECLVNSFHNKKESMENAGTLLREKAIQFFKRMKF